MPELLSPAGDFEKLSAALRYGADAVYLGGDYSMRVTQSSFRGERLKEAVKLCHESGKKLYLTVNTLPRNHEMDGMEDYLRFAAECKVDAVLVTDLGVLAAIKRTAPSLNIHISTQMGVVNYASAAALYEMGAKRVVLARELSLEEIAEIRAKTPPELELEAFVHGAMCMSVSGRCLISEYLTGRDANRGNCAQPCRWNYRLVEEKRPGQYFPIVEEKNGSYLLNAKDLCMLPYLDQLLKAGIGSFKIEGRAKSAYYVAVVTNAYRAAMNALLRDPAHYAPPAWALEEVEKVSHRHYSTGFYFGRAEQYPKDGGYLRSFDVTAVVTGWKENRLFCSQRNKFCEGDQMELIAPLQPPVKITVRNLKGEDGVSIGQANHAQMALSFDCETPFEKGSLLRMERTR